MGRHHVGDEASRPGAGDVEDDRDGVRGLARVVRRGHPAGLEADGEGGEGHREERDPAAAADSPLRVALPQGRHRRRHLVGPVPGRAEDALAAGQELVEIGHFGVPAITQAMGHPRPDIRARLRRAIVLATAVYFPSPSGAATSDPWEAEKLDARAAQLVSQLANPALANGAAEELKKQPFSHFAKPRLIDALHSRELQRKAAQVLAELAEQDASQSLAQWEEWYTRTWDGWYKKEKDRLGFGTDYSKWKLWYRMNKDHL